MRRALRLIPLIGLLAMAACNTVAGAGQDIKAGGSAITSGANDVKAKL